VFLFRPIHPDERGKTLALGFLFVYFHDFLLCVVEWKTRWLWPGEMLIVQTSIAGQHLEDSLSDQSASSRLESLSAIIAVIAFGVRSRAMRVPSSKMRKSLELFTLSFPGSAELFTSCCGELPRALLAA
jgi:hypothetical protein